LGGLHDESRQDGNQRAGGRDRRKSNLTPKVGANKERASGKLGLSMKREAARGETGQGVTYSRGGEAKFGASISACTFEKRGMGGGP